MATNGKKLVKKGIPVKRVWSDSIDRKGRENGFPTIYPIYFTDQGFGRYSITGTDAPKSLRKAEDMARAILEDSALPWTTALIYKMEATTKLGIEFDYQQHHENEEAKHIEEGR
jgi:hypothetical protein